MGQVIKLYAKKNSFNNQVSELINICQGDLETINSIIIEKLGSNIPLIHEIASYLILSGGKRLRPLLTSCSFRLFEKNTIENINHIGLAAAVEFIHAATLLHDDVIDESKKRRGNLSVNEVWGNKTSVLVGDFLFSRAFQLMAKYGNTAVLKLLSDTSVTISEGEMLELSNDKDPTINEDIYYDVINGKTASLFSAACQVGGISAQGSDRELEYLKSFGANFGMSFQLIDDAIDYSSSNIVLGKNIGDDFKEGKVTLPIILAYLRSNKAEKDFWKKTIVHLKQEKDDFHHAINIIKKYDCIEDTIDRARHFANVAIDSLGSFKDNNYKIGLINLIQSSLNRLN
ncbi:MAG: polyprenyl synthetase family protein [Alphaproteobacteria bacterium]|jgi:octaprenyl-diphosphate synthase|nr:polyprenyl synthetase family protein [Alphaproteobacteria bacterium]